MTRRIEKGMTRLGIALGSLALLSALQAQGVWNWDAGVCPNNIDWHGHCYAGICPGDASQSYWVNNWRVYRCGSPSNLIYPGPGSTVNLNWTANDFTVSLSRNVEISSLFSNNRCYFRWEDGWITLRNANTVGTWQNQGVIHLVRPSGSDLVWEANIENSGRFIQSGRRLYYRNANFLNTGTLELQQGGWYIYSGTSGAYTGTDLVRKTTSGTFEIAIPFSHNGEVRVEAGNLTMRGAILSSTTWNVFPGAILDWVTDTVSNTHQGDVQGTARILSGITTSAPLTLNFVGNGITWQNGAHDFRNGGLTNQGVLRVQGSGDVDWRGNIQNSGTIIVQQPPPDRGLYFRNATVTNTGVFEVRQGILAEYGGTTNNQLINSGEVRKTSSAVFTLYTPIVNNGEVRAQEGRLVMRSRRVTGNGVWRALSGATLEWQANPMEGTHVWEAQGGTILITGSLTAGASGLNLTIRGNETIWRSGWHDFGSPGLTIQGTFRVEGSGGDIDWGGQIRNEGTLVQESRNLYFNNAVLTNAGTFQVQSNCWCRYGYTTGNRVQNLGVVRKISGSTLVSGVPVENRGLLDIQSGIFEFVGSGILTQQSGEMRIRQGATLRSSNPVSMQGGKLTGAGTLSGNLTTSDDNNQNTPPATIAPGISDPNEPTANPIGILTLDGNLTLDASAVLEAELAGTSNADPNNPQYDQLRIAGSGYTRTVQLNGTLRLKGRNNFVPNVGQVFDIILRTASGWTRTGTFSRVEVDPETLPCVEVAVRYLADRVRVEVTRTGDNPDTNRDGCVDDADLLNVLFAFGQTGSNPADVNCDGVVDDADLLSVLFAFGRGC